MWAWSSPRGVFGVGATAGARAGVARAPEPLGLRARSGVAACEVAGGAHATAARGDLSRGDTPRHGSPMAVVVEAATPLAGAAVNRRAGAVMDSAPFWHRPGASGPVAGRVAAPDPP